jgi:tight adherence protein C
VLQETPQLIKLLAVVGTFAGTSLLVYVLLRERAVRLGIRSSLEDPRLSHPSLADTRASVMRGPFAQRILGPATKKAAGLVYRFGPGNLAEQTRRRLVLAGLDARLDADTFFAISMAGPVVLLALMIALSRAGGFAPILWVAVPLSGFLPKMWLTSKVEHRQKAIRLALADTLDLLTIAVEAGLGFDSAVARVVTSIPGPLSDELYRMLQELKIGVPRNQALKNLAERTDIDDLDQFITAVSQADSFGIAVGKVLRVQAKQLRQKRSQAAEERAAKTPVKLLFPLILCIFPALFVVLVGPAAIQIIESLFGNI